MREDEAIARGVRARNDMAEVMYCQDTVSPGFLYVCYVVAERWMWVRSSRVNRMNLIGGKSNVGASEFPVPARIRRAAAGISAAWVVCESVQRGSRWLSDGQLRGKMRWGSMVICQ